MLGAGDEEEEEEEEKGEVERGNGDGDGEGGRLRNFLDVECFCGQVMGMSSKEGLFFSIESSFVGFPQSLESGKSVDVRVFGRTTSIRTWTWVWNSSVLCLWQS